MTETDLDTQADNLLTVDQDEQTPTPWESIDPDEAPATYESPFASAASIAAEAKDGAPATPLASHLLVDRFAKLDQESATALSEEQREEQLADRAFFSDQKISLAVLESPEAPSGEHAQLDAARVAVSGFMTKDDVADATLRDVVQQHAFEGIAKSRATDGAALESEIAPVVETIDFEAAPSRIEDAAEELVELQRDNAADAIDAPVLNEAVSAKAEENVIAPAPSLADLDGIEEPVVVPEAAQNTPWDTLDETATEVAEPLEALGSQELIEPLVSRAIPMDAAVEPAISVTSSESLEAAASELTQLDLSTQHSSLDGALDTQAIEEPLGETILVTSSPEHGLAGLVEASAQPLTQPLAATEVEVELEPELEPGAPSANSGALWTIPLMCLGIGLIACCMVIPQGESNRQLRYEQAALAADLQQVQKQVAVNNEFLSKVADDPTLAERLAGRQMKTIRRGQKVVDLAGVTKDGDMSPFSLVNVAKAADLPPYKPRTGTIANLCNNARSRLYLLGVALAMVAVGLVMGYAPSTQPPSERRVS